MTAVTSEQWLELHRRTLDCARGAVLGLGRKELLWGPLTAMGDTEERSCQEPHPFCIAGVLAHICAAERYWLGEVQIRANFQVPEEPDWHPERFEEALRGIERQYHEVLRERPDDPDVLFGLGRVCQHNLYHVAQIVHLRSSHDPEWMPPPPGHRGSWERAADYMSDLVILGEKAPAEPPNPDSALKE